MGIDASIYVGDSVTVRKNSVTNHADGIEIENTSNAVVEENSVRGNSGGVVVLVFPGLEPNPCRSSPTSCPCAMRISRRNLEWTTGYRYMKKSGVFASCDLLLISLWLSPDWY